MFASIFFAVAAPPLNATEIEQRVSLLITDERMQHAKRALSSQRDWTNEQMVAINEIPAPPFGEQARANDVAARLRATFAVDVSLDEIGNVIALHKGAVGARTIAVVAHLDTVFPADTDVSVQRVGDVFTAPGIGDNARGVAMLLALSAAISKAELTFRDNVLFIGSVGEEGLGDLRGVRALFGDDGPDIDAFIAIDGGKLERLVTSAVGSHRYRVSVKGPGGHSFGHFGRANPHHALASAITLFRTAAQEITNAEGAKATFSVGRIGGGTSINSIAFESWMEIDLRSVDQTRLDRLDAALMRSVTDALEIENGQRTRGDALTVSIDSVGRRPAGQQDAKQPLIQRAIAAQRLLGLEPVLIASSTDANIPIALGIPAVTIARGGLSRNAHALNESWEDRDTLRSEWFALLLIAAEAGLVN
ncbi:MAG: M20/M25/M40 family metallo-hydrolase [Pseudomonadota bacterium]